MAGFLGWTPEHGLFPPREEGQENALLKFMQRLAGGARETQIRQIEELTGEPYEGGPGWADIFTVADAHEDIGIGAQRQLRGIDEGYGQGGVADMVWRLLGDFVRGDSQTYQSPYGPDQSESVQMQGVQEAGLGERMASGLMVYGGGGIDLAQGLGTGVRAVAGLADNAMDSLGLAAARAVNVDELGAEVMSRVPRDQKGMVAVLSKVFNQGDAGLPARRKAQSNSRVGMIDDAGDWVGPERQADLRQTFFSERLQNMTPENADRWEAAIKNGLQIEEGHRVLDLKDGRTVDLAHWYDTSPVLNELTSVLGEKEGEMFYTALMALTAVTSPRTAVRDNVDLAVSLMHHFSRGTSMDEIMRMTQAQFGTISPGKVAFHAGYSGTAGNYVGGRGGALKTLIERGEINGQKISSFFNNLMGDFTPLTVDSHNLRQTLALSGVPMDSGAARRELINRLGVADKAELHPFFEDVVRIVDEDGVEQILDAADVPRVLADQLYATSVASTSLYSNIENFQLDVMNKLISEGRIPQMTPAEFQARLWVGASEASQVRDSVPLAQAMMDAIEKYGRTVMGTDNIDNAIRHIWKTPGGENVLYEAIYNAGDYAQAGISFDDFRNLLVRGAAKATPHDEEREEDLLGLVGLGGM